MSSHQQLVDRLFDLTTQGDTQQTEFARLDALVYGRLAHTYGDDETFEAALSIHAAADLVAEAA